MGGPGSSEGVCKEDIFTKFVFLRLKAGGVVGISIYERWISWVHINVYRGSTFTFLVGGGGLIEPMSGSEWVQLSPKNLT